MNNFFITATIIWQEIIGLKEWIPAKTMPE